MIDGAVPTIFSHRKEPKTRSTRTAAAATARNSPAPPTPAAPMPLPVDLDHSYSSHSVLKGAVLELRALHRITLLAAYYEASQLSLVGFSDVLEVVEVVDSQSIQSNSTNNSTSDPGKCEIDLKRCKNELASVSRLGWYSNNCICFFVIL